MCNSQGLNMLVESGKVLLRVGGVGVDGLVEALMVELGAVAEAVAEAALAVVDGEGEAVEIAQRLSQPVVVRGDVVEPDREGAGA